MPYVPNGWLEEHEVYVSSEDREKSQIWKNMSSRFYAYIKGKDETEAKNKSNKSFLTDILNHFTKLGFLKHAEVIKNKLAEFERIIT